MNKDNIKAELRQKGWDAACAYEKLPHFNPGFRLDCKSSFGLGFNAAMNHGYPDVRYPSAHICKY